MDEVLSTLLPGTDQEARETHAYPEQILHSAPKGNKYYTCFEQLSRLFIQESSLLSTGNLQKLRIHALLQEKVKYWNNESAGAPADSPIASPRKETAKSLFSWSSGDDYIAARKRELATHQDPPRVAPPLRVHTPQIQKPLFTGKLNQIVERESNRFIQDRIDVIQARHLEQVSREVSERKRRDHERYVLRMKQKEEEYDKALNAAIRSRKENRRSNFFSVLFGSKPKSRSLLVHNLDPDLEAQPEAGLPDAVLPEVVLPEAELVEPVDKEPEPEKPDKIELEPKIELEKKPEPQLVGLDEAFGSFDLPPARPQPTNPSKHSFLPLEPSANNDDDLLLL